MERWPASPNEHGGVPGETTEGRSWAGLTGGRSPSAPDGGYGSHSGRHRSRRKGEGVVKRGKVAGEVERHTARG